MFKFCLTILACLVSGSFAWSQNNIRWTKEYYGIGDSSSVSVIGLYSGNNFFHTVRYGSFFSAYVSFSPLGNRIFSINDSQIEDSSSLKNYRYYAPMLAINDSSFYSLSWGNIQPKLSIENKFQTQQSYIFQHYPYSFGNLGRKGSQLSLTATMPNSDICVYRFDSVLTLIDSTLISASSLSSVGNYQPNGLGSLFYNPISKKYWISTHDSQIVLDSLLNPEKIVNSQSYGPVDPFLTTLKVYTSPTQVELPTYSILSTGAGKRTDINLFETHFFRVTKWNENYEIVDSLEFSYFPSLDKGITTTGSSISWNGDPKEIYLCGVYGNGAHDSTNFTVVAKIDSSLNLHWMRAYNHPVLAFSAFGVKAVPGGGAIIYGGAANYIPGTSTLNSIGYLVRIDSTGAVLTSSDPQMQVEKDFIAYPNPAKHELYFSAQHDSKPIDIQIFNALGTLVYQEKNAQQIQLSLEGWSTGIYTYRVRCENRVTSGKVVKE